MTRSPIPREDLKWFLLAEATTDYYAVWEGIEYGCELLGKEHSEQVEDDVLAALGELLQNRLIDLFLQKDGLASDEPPRVLPLEEAITRLGEARFHSEAITPPEEMLMFASTRRGEEAFSSLTPDQVDRIFGSTGTSPT